LSKLTIRKLTIGLFWINPTQFLPCDKKTRAYAEHKGVSIVPADYRSYREWLASMTSIMGDQYAQVSHNAHVWATQQGIKDEPEEEQDVSSPTGPRFWLVAPGRKAKRWDDFHSEGIIAIDWGQISDLSQFASKEAIRKHLQKHHGGDSSKKNDALACWQFAHEMKQGDVVIAKEGTDTIV